MEGVFRRGKKGRFTARLQVPVQFRTVVGKAEIWQATGTADYDEAMEFRLRWKRQMLADWNAQLSGKQPSAGRSCYELAAELALSRGEDYRTADEVAEMPLEVVLSRIENLQTSKATPSGVVAEAMLGGIEIPQMSLMEVARSMPSRYPEDWAHKTPRGKKVWESRWLRPAKKFIEILGADPEFSTIQRRDAVAFRDMLRDQVLEDECKAESAIKELDNLTSLWKRHFEALGVDPDDVPPSPWRNLRAPLAKLSEGEAQKLEIPMENLKRIVAPGCLDGMNSELRDVIYVLIETGARQSEITDIPPGSIHLDADIPHLVNRKETGEFARNIKNAASKRLIPLVGIALDAMRRHPDGFPRYRGTGTFSAAANAFLHENKILPDDITVGGSRHSFESRMKAAGFDNEDRGYMMGHSIKRIRGREVYGDDMSLARKLEIAEQIKLVP